MPKSARKRKWQRRAARLAAESSGSRINNTGPVRKKRQVSTEGTRAAAPKPAAPAAGEFLHRVLLTTGEERKADVSRFLSGLREAERSARQKTKVVVFANRPHQARQLQRFLGAARSKKERTKRGSTKPRVWSFRGVEWVHKRQTDDERRESLQNFRSGKAHTVISSDEEAAPLLSQSSSIRMLVHFDFAETLDLYRERLEYAAALGGGQSVSFFDPAKDDKGILDALVKLCDDVDPEVQKFVTKEGVIEAKQASNAEENKDEEDFGAFKKAE